MGLFLVLPTNRLQTSADSVFPWFWCTGQSHGPPTPPTTPKIIRHVSNKHDVHRCMDVSTSSVPPTSRQNIDFSNVDISELSADVISTTEGFNVHEFDQYLSPKSHTVVSPPDATDGHNNPSRSLILSSLQSIPTLTPKSGTSTGIPLSSTIQDRHMNQKDTSGPNPQVRTEHMSPDYHNISCISPPPQSEHTSISSANCHSSIASSSSTNQPEYTDLQSSSFYSAITRYPAPLYHYPYFHSSCRPYATSLINSLVLPPPLHSTPSGWEQSIYTTLTRP